MDATKTETFVLDELNRLLSASSQATGTLGYTYDAVGNITSKEGRTYVYGDPLRPYVVTAVVGAGGIAGDQAFTYDYENRLSSATRDGIVTSFAYDDYGSRVKKSGVAGTTVYVGGLYECAGGTCTRHIFAANQRIASVTSTGLTLYYHADHLGSTRAVTDQPAAGHAVSVLERIAYGPFGTTRTDTAPGITRYKYTSQELDPETGFYYYKARYYDAALGRFLTPDPSGIRLDTPQGLNPFAYALNNPVRFSDPTGLDFLDSVGNFFSDLWNQMTNQGVFLYAGNGTGGVQVGVGVGNSDPWYPLVEPAYYYFCAESACEATSIGGSTSQDNDEFIGDSNLPAVARAHASTLTHVFARYSAGMHVLAWWTGLGPDRFTYGPNDPETIAFRDSKAYRAVLSDYMHDGLQDGLNRQLDDSGNVYPNDGVWADYLWVGQFNVNFYPHPEDNRLVLVKAWNVHSMSSFFHPWADKDEKGILLPFEVRSYERLEGHWRPGANVREVWYWYEWVDWSRGPRAR